MAEFDLSAARRAGYSDAEIVDALAARRNFDAAGARQAGYSDRALLAALMRPPERSTGERVARGAAMPFAGFNESLATTVGAPVDLATAGINGMIGLANAGARLVGAAPEGADMIPRIQDPIGGSASVRRGLRAVTGEPPKPETTVERGLYGAGRGAGDAAAIMVPGAAMARLAPAGSVMAGVGETIAAQPAMQAISGAVGGGVAEMTDSPLAGMAASLAVPAARAVASRALRPVQSQLNQEAQRLLSVADAEGIPTTAGQRTGSTALQGMEAAFERMPFTSGPQGAIRADQQQAFNRAVLARAGVDADAATPQVLEQAQRRIGGEIGAIARRNTAQVTPEVRDALDNLRTEVSQFAEADIGRIVANRIAQIDARIVDGTIPGRTVRELDTALGRQIRATQSGDLRTYLREVQDILRDALRFGAGEADAAALAQARRHYANLMVIENAAGGAGTMAARGDISPAQLRMALSQSVGRRGYAAGQGDLNDVVRAGEQFVKPQIPNSGTAERAMWGQVLTGGTGGGIGAAAGGPVGAMVGTAAGLAAPRAVQAAYNAPFIQNWLANGASRSVDAPTRNAMMAIIAAQGKGALAER